MGDIIKRYPARSTVKEKQKMLRFYFDSGSPRTFVKESVALTMKDVVELTEPEVFYGLGDGSFKARYMIRLKVKLLNLWIPHFCYVVPDAVLERRYDVLLGHDFMQIYDIHLKPKKQSVLIDKEALRMALKVRRCYVKPPEEFQNPCKICPTTSF